MEPSKIGDAYRTLYTCISKIPDSGLGISEVKLIQVSDPIATDAMAIRDRQPARLPVRIQGKRLGNLSVEEAYIYPRVGGQMTSGEILQTLSGMAGRPAVTSVRPSVITLRTGAKLKAFIAGFNLQMSDGLTIDTLDAASNAKRSIAADDVANIQP